MFKDPALQRKFTKTNHGLSIGQLTVLNRMSLTCDACCWSSLSLFTYSGLSNCYGGAAKPA